MRMCVCVRVTNRCHVGKGGGEFLVSVLYVYIWHMCVCGITCIYGICEYMEYVCIWNMCIYDVYAWNHVYIWNLCIYGIYVYIAYV